MSYWIYAVRKDKDDEFKAAGFGLDDAANVIYEEGTSWFDSGEQIVIRIEEHSDSE